MTWSGKTIIKRLTALCAAPVLAALCGCGGAKPSIVVNDPSAFSGNEKFEMAKKEVMFSHAHIVDTAVQLREISAIGMKAKPVIAPAFVAARKIAIASFVGNLTSEKQSSTQNGTTTTTWLKFGDTFKMVFLAYAHGAFTSSLKKQSREFELIPVGNVITNGAYAAMPYGDTLKDGFLKSLLLGAGPVQGVAAPGYKFILPPVGEKLKDDTLEADMVLRGMSRDGPISLVTGFAGTLTSITGTRKDPLAAVKKDMAALCSALEADMVLTVENGIIGNLYSVDGSIKDDSGIEFFVDRIIVNAFDKKGDLVWSGRLETPVAHGGSAEGADVESIWSKISAGYRLACDLVVYKMVLDHGGTPNTADSPPLPAAPAVQPPAVDASTAAPAAAESPKADKDAAAKTAKVQELAKKGNVNAQFLLARLHFTGKYADQDLPAAFSWCRKAALKGHKDAPLFLGAMYYEGKGTKQNFQEAFKWLKKAADGGNAKAMFMVGEMYFKGEGTARSGAEAERYYSEAAKLGHKGAEAKLAEIAKPKKKGGFDMELGGFGGDDLNLGNP